MQIRGIKVITTTVSNVIRLVSFAVLGNNIFSNSNAIVYVGIAAGTVAGTAIGSHLRLGLDTEVILRGLYVVLILSTATMFDTVMTDALSFGLFCGCVAAFAATLSAWVWLNTR